MLRFFQDKPSRRLRGVFLLNLKGNRVCREDSSDPRVITFYGVGQKWNEHATPPRNIVATSKSKLILRAVNLSTAARWIVSLNRFIYGYEHTEDEYTTNEKVLAKRNLGCGSPAFQGLNYIKVCFLSFSDSNYVLLRKTNFSICILLILSFLTLILSYVVFRLIYKILFKPNGNDLHFDH